MLFSILSLEAFYFFEKINFLLQKVGTGEWGQGWSDKIFMYCVFHHISDQLQRQILFWKILQKSCDTVRPKPKRLIFSQADQNG